MYESKCRCKIIILKFKNFNGIKKYSQIFLHFLPSEEFENIKYKSDPQSLPPREIPPYNGFGSEEDSLATCLSLRPKPTRRDFKKFMEKDR